MAVDWLWRKPGNLPLVVAHRGSSGAAPENTRASFELAIAQGAPAVECDVVLTADRVPVVIHDSTLDRTTNGTGAVDELPWASLVGFDNGSWKDPRFAGERLLRLDELLGLAHGRTRVVIELKAGDPDALAEATRDAIAAHPGGEVAVISFVPEVVRAVRRMLPDVAVGYLYHSRQPWSSDHAEVVRRTIDLGAHFLGPEQILATAELCELAHRVGLPVSIWTCNDVETMRARAEAGVDAITTDWPDLALAQFASGAFSATSQTDG